MSAQKKSLKLLEAGICSVILGLVSKDPDKGYKPFSAFPNQN